MDWNLRTASDWDWENLTGFSTKTTDISKQAQPTINKTKGDGGMDNPSLYSSGAGDFSGSDMGHDSLSKSSFSASADSSSKEGMKIYSTAEDIPNSFGEMNDLTTVNNTENFPSLGACVHSGEPIIGLKLGRRTYFEDVCAASTDQSLSSSMISSSSSATTKRSRASYQSTQSPRCQVEGCNLDLKSAKDYHRRHRICESHSKSPKVIVAGMERRFCQQCSRFHELSEFDDKKRSCRRRLSDHNARRRRPHSEAIQFNSARLSSSFYSDGRQEMNFLANRVPFAAANPKWPSACSFKFTQAGDFFSRPGKAEGTGRQLNVPNNQMPSATSRVETDSTRILSFGSSTHRVLSEGLEASALSSNLDVAPDFQRALSLLSTTSWDGSNESESTSLDNLVFVNKMSMLQPMIHVELPKLPLASLDHEQVEQPPPVSEVPSLSVPNEGSIHSQEFQSLKTPYESGCFYSNQMS